MICIPGKTGEYAIELSTEDSDLPVAFELIFHIPHIVDESTGEILSTTKDYYDYYVLFQNIYYDTEYAAGTRLDHGGIVGFKGVMMPSKKLTILLYYKWRYEHSDNEDENGVQYYAGENTSLQITIIGRQVDISNDDTLFSSAFADLLGITNFNNCSNGSLSYPNKYGYSCKLMTLTPDLDNSIIETDDAIIFPIFFGLVK